MISHEWPSETLVLIRSREEKNKTPTGDFVHDYPVIGTCVGDSGPLILGRAQSFLIIPLFIIAVLASSTWRSISAAASGVSLKFARPIPIDATA